MGRTPTTEGDSKDPCEFYFDGKHHWKRSFWGWTCDRCGRVKP
jgi:hypothetical protein